MAYPKKAFTIGQRVKLRRKRHCIDVWDDKGYMAIGHPGYRKGRVHYYRSFHKARGCYELVLISSSGATQTVLEDELIQYGRKRSPKRFLREVEKNPGVFPAKFSYFYTVRDRVAGQVLRSTNYYTIRYRSGKLGVGEENFYGNLVRNGKLIPPERKKEMGKLPDQLRPGKLKTYDKVTGSFQVVDLVHKTENRPKWWELVLRYIVRIFTEKK